MKLPPTIFIPTSTINICPIYMRTNNLVVKHWKVNTKVSHLNLLACNFGIMSKMYNLYRLKIFDDLYKNLEIIFRNI